MKKSLLLVLLAMCATLLFSCSEAKIELPSDWDLGWVSEDPSPIECVVDIGKSKACYKVSEHTCLDIIGGHIKEEEEMCINFTCKWDKASVKYGRSSALSFEFKSESEGCAIEKISYKGKELDTAVSYIISSSTFPGLSHSTSATIDAEATVACEGQQYTQPCDVLTVDPVTPPKAECKWNPNKVKYGSKSSLSFAIDSESDPEENCVLEKISYKTRTLKPDTSYTISASIFSGLSPSKDTSIVATATITCGNQDKWEYDQECEELEIDSVPNPKWDGKLSFKKFDHDSSFFIGKTITKDSITSTLAITNKADAECGDIVIKITGSPAKLGTPVKATAYVYCRYTDTLELASISANVLPDPKIGDCEIVGDKTTMRSSDTLKISISVDNDYGRCNKKEYKINGVAYKADSSFSLTSSGNKTLDSVYARVTCGTATPVTKKCPTVKVANHKKEECTTSENRDAFSIVKGTTILEFTCNKSKEDFYISCRPGPDQLPDYSQKHTYTVEIEGHSVGTTNNDIRAIVGDNGYNFPDIIQQVGNIYVYPKEIIISAEKELKCGIW